MAQADTIKDFLISLGFQVDPAGERRFLDSMAAATVKATMLGEAVMDAASAVVSGVARIADNLEQLYFASQRTNAAAENIQAFGFAARQMGVDAGAAQGAIESLARFIRNNPGGEGLLKNLGIHTRDANGHMRDTVDLMGDLGEKFAGMPYYRANAYAQALGIDEKTLMAMRQGMGQFSAEYKDMLHRAGVDSQEAAKSSHAFMVEVRSWGAAIGVLVQKIIGQMTGPMGDGLHRLRESFVKNFDWIAAVIGGVLGIVGRIVGAIAALGARFGEVIHWVAQWFEHLTPAGKGLIETIIGITVAWRALSLAMMMSPLGIVIALATAILALWDDYKTWKEGGKSLIDWSAWEPGIEAAINGIKFLASAIADIVNGLGRMGADMVHDILSIGGMVGDAAYKLGQIVCNRFLDALDFTSGIRKKIEHALSGATGSAPHRSGSGTFPGAATGPRGIRNNNPGNINYGAWARAHGSTGLESGAGGRFATFGNAQAGLDALADLLTGSNYIGGGIDSVRAIISKYAPSKDHNNTAAYIASVAKRLGVDPNAHLDPHNMAQMAGLVDSIVRVENGKNPYSAEMINQAAARAVGLNQTTTITVNASGDAKAIAQETATAQNSVNGQLVRNMRGAAF